MAVNGVAIGEITVGGILLWSGLTGKSFASIFKSLASGKSVPLPASTPLNTSVTEVGGPSQGLPYGTVGVNTGANSAAAAKNQAIARLLAAPYGWSSGQEWSDLVSLWNQESGWNNYADNSSSGAYGIPQALPASKMGVAANPPLSSATAQIAWGLGYIKSTYGDPIGAWAHEQANGWY